MSKEHLYHNTIALLALLFMGSVSLGAQETSVFPDVDPHDFYGNMTMTVVVKDQGTVVTDVEVAVYAGNELRAKGVPTDLNKPGVIYLSVNGDSSGDPLHFMISVGGKVVKVAPDGLLFKLNGIVGSPRNPYVVNLADAISILLGDANTDGSVTITDALAIVYRVLNKDLAQFDSIAADINQDSSVTITDALAVVKQVLGSTSHAKAITGSLNDILDPQ